MPAAVPSENFTVAYVLTSDGRDDFADMALVSLLSVRISNPSLRIVVVCDGQTVQALKSARHRILKVCDELVSVATPDGEPALRNRWIKTQLDRFVVGNALCLDADTLVRGSLAELPALVAELGAVANHNGVTLAKQHWIEDEAVAVGMGWPVHFENFVNGGFLFFKPCPRVREFFAQWHELWRAGMAANGRLRDQPALNSAILLSGVGLKMLPAGYNAQMFVSWQHAPAATVWHFYASVGERQNSFARLTAAAGELRLWRLRRRIKSALKAPAPWINFDWVARRLAERVELRGIVPLEEGLWLAGRRRESLRLVWDAVRSGLAGTFSPGQPPQ